MWHITHLYPIGSNNLGHHQPGILLKSSKYTIHHAQPCFIPWSYCDCIEHSIIKWYSVMLSKIYLWFENHLASTGFVCFLILMPVYLIFQKKSCVFTEVWSYPERVLEHYWGPAAWPGQWPEPDSCLHRGGWRQITIPIITHISSTSSCQLVNSAYTFPNDDNLPRTGVHPESRVWWTVSGTPPSVEPSSISSL